MKLQKPFHASIQSIDITQETFKLAIFLFVLSVFKPIHKCVYQMESLKVQLDNTKSLIDRQDLRLFSLISFFQALDIKKGNIGERVLRRKSNGLGV